MAVLTRTIRTARLSSLLPQTRQCLVKYSSTKDVKDSAEKKRKDIGPGKTHLLDKSDHGTDPQTAASEIAHREREADSSNSAATSERDVNNAKEKAKLEFPEARDPFLGNNDERGGKGH